MFKYQFVFQDATFAIVVNHVLVAACHIANANVVTMNAMKVCQFLSAWPWCRTSVTTLTPSTTVSAWLHVQRNNKHKHVNRVWRRHNSKHQRNRGKGSVSFFMFFALGLRCLRKLEWFKHKWTFISLWGASYSWFAPTTHKHKHNVEPVTEYCRLVLMLIVSVNTLVLVLMLMPRASYV